LNLVPVYFVSAWVIGLPLKTAEFPAGTFLDQELYLKLRDIYNYIFLQDDPSTKISREIDVRGYCLNFARIAEAHLISISAQSLPLLGLVDSAYHFLTDRSKLDHDWIARLHSSGRPRSELVNDIVALGILASVEYSQALTHVVNKLLDITAEIVPIAKSNNSESIVKLKAYIVEALRIAPPLSGVYRDLATDLPSKAGDTYKRGDRVYVSLSDAGVDPTAFPTNPSTLDPSRTPTEKLLWDGLYKLLGEEWILTTMVPVIKTIFSLKNVQRAPGTSGQLFTVVHDIAGAKVRSYLDSSQKITPWSTDLTISYLE